MTGIIHGSSFTDISMNQFDSSLQNDMPNSRSLSIITSKQEMRVICCFSFVQLEMNNGS